MTDQSPRPDATPADPTPPVSARGRDRELLERLAFRTLADLRRARRWNLAFRFAWLAFAVALAAILMEPEWLESGSSGPHSALVDVRGVIGDDGDASADRIVAALQAAFEDADTAGVILRINSPGGSPVQAGYVSDEIVRLRELHPDTPLYAVIGDIAASGGYYVAAAADAIYASRSSLVGSIGVLMDSFGFVAAMEKVGVERRLIVAGENKGFLDPFSPMRDADVTHLRSLLEEVRGEFVEVVKRGRGDRLAGDDDIFSGLMWSGARSIELGLVDAIGSSGYVAREVIGADDIVDFTIRPSHLDTIANQLGAGVARAVASVLALDTPGLGGGFGGGLR